MNIVTFMGLPLTSCGLHRGLLKNLFRLLLSVDPEMATEQVDTGASTPPPKRQSPLDVEDRQCSETDVRIYDDGTTQYRHISVEVEKTGPVSLFGLLVPGAIPCSDLAFEYPWALQFMTK